MTRILVLHSHYSCETGCCGHVVEVDGKELAHSFEFSHPRVRNAGQMNERQLEDAGRAYAIDLVRRKYGEEHVKDIDFDGCLVLDD